MSGQWDELRKKLEEWRSANMKALESPINPRIASSLKQEIACIGRIIHMMKVIDSPRPLTTSLASFVKQPETA